MGISVLFITIMAVKCLVGYLPFFEVKTRLALAVGSILLFAKIRTYQKEEEKEEGNDTQIPNLGILNFLIMGWSRWTPKWPTRLQP